jgi:signal transduction histidine kinase
MAVYDLLWARLSLPKKFLIAGGIVMLVATLFVGNWVSKRIEDAVVHNSASTVALYMDSFISPISQELRDAEQLSDVAQRALSEIFKGTAVGDRVVSVKIWKKGGLVVYASDENIIGQRFEPSEDLRNAWTGQISAAFEDLDHDESEHEALMNVPLLEVYSPITEPWTGKIIAVAEFYERAEGLKGALRQARWSSWMVVSLSFLTSGLLLYGIVRAGGSTIQQQQMQLLTQLADSRKMANQNASLKQRVVDASGRATAQADRALRQLGSELHDGPAQYISLAALRLDSVLPKSKKGTKDAEDIKHALNTALGEIRALSRGLAVPDLDNLDVHSIIARAIDDHNKHNDQNVVIPQNADDNLNLGYTSKLCVFRFVQECLSNSLKHTDNAIVEVMYGVSGDMLTVAVSDNGPGFDIDTALTLREDGGQGLLGLIDRAESIGGTVDIQSTAGIGTKIILSLPLQKG